MQTVVMYKNDLLPKLMVQMWDATGAFLDLTNVLSVTINIGTDATNLIVTDKPLTIANAVQGICYYYWQSGDTAVPGQYLAEVVVNYAGKKQTAVVFNLIIQDSLH